MIDRIREYALDAKDDFCFAKIPKESILLGVSERNAIPVVRFITSDYFAENQKYLVDIRFYIATVNGNELPGLCSCKPIGMVKINEDDYYIFIDADYDRWLFPKLYKET